MALAIVDAPRGGGGILPASRHRLNARHRKTAGRQAPRATKLPTSPTRHMPYMNPSTKNPLHGVTLEQLLTELVAHYGWPGLAQRIDIRCFSSNPSIKSSLTFLRKTPWAREKVEALFVQLRQGKA
jgi:hypothetical protein